MQITKNKVINIFAAIAPLFGVSINPLLGFLTSIISASVVIYLYNKSDYDNIELKNKTINFKSSQYDIDLRLKLIEFKKKYPNTFFENDPHTRRYPCYYQNWGDFNIKDLIRLVEMNQLNREEITYLDTHYKIS